MFTSHWLDLLTLGSLIGPTVIGIALMRGTGN